MVRIERLRLGHRDALLAFEVVNRAYFAALVPDRGDAYFDEFDARHAALLAEQETGRCHFHVLVYGAEIVGRVNLVDVEDGDAELGFRVAERVAGRGVATAGVRDVCALARDGYQLTSLRAAAADRNVGSRTVLVRNGFVATGDVVTLNGKPGLWYRLEL